MFYTKKEKRKLKNELKRELLDELERISKKDAEAERLYRASYKYSYNENNQVIVDEFRKLYNMIAKLQNDVDMLSRRVERVEQIGKSGINTNAVSYQMTDRKPDAANVTSNDVASQNESFCTVFNKYINTGSMHSDFESINLSYEVDKFSETDSGTALYYIVQLYDNEYELYPNHRFVDRRACQRAEKAFEFDIQGNEKIYVNKPCRLRKLMYGYAVEEKGNVSIL